MEQIRLDIVPKGIMPVCHASQYDKGRVIRCNLMDGLQGYVLTDETIVLKVCKPDDNIVTAAVEVISGTSYVDIVTTEQMTACEGNNICELTMSKDDVVISTLNFRMQVEVDPLKDGVESETVIHNLESMVDEMVAEEVATQYDSENVIFDSEPTSGHGTPYTVTSEGIKTAIDNAFDYDNTASGSIVHITDGADNIPVKSLVSEIVAVESGSGEKSPDNPYSISGFDSGIITRCGKNLFDNSLMVNSQTTVVGDTVTLTATGNFQGSAFAFMPVKQGYKYALKIDSLTSGSAVEIRRYNASGTVTNTVVITQSTIININDGTTAKISIVYGNRVAGAGTFILKGFNIALGENYQSYEAYNGNDYTFAFGQTVYGGHFDNKGNLVVTHIFGELVATSKNGNYFRATLSELGLPNIYDKNADLFCDRYAVADVTTATSNDNQITVYGDVGDAYAIRWVDLNYLNADVSTYNSAMASNKPKICYKLLNPITLSIASQDIPTLLGENNIFSNCGDVEVEYYTSKSDDILEFINSEIDKKNGTNIPIEEDSQDSIKDYIDDEVSSIDLESLPDTDISSPSANQVLSFDGNNWVNANQIVVKYEEKDITFDSTGEGTLYFANGYILGLKDIPSDSLYIGYITYMAGTKTMVKGFNRSATSFDSTAIANTTRKIGIYYLDNIVTQ